MSGLFSSLNIASNALTVNESAISVVSHNVSNMNTEGYHKQRANLVTRNNAGTIGNNVQAQIRSNGGVTISNVLRYNDDYLNNYYREQLSTLNKYEQQLSDIDDLADIFNDLEGTGIDSALSDFYEALNNLNEYPASSTARTNFIETTKTLISSLNSKNQQLGELTSKALGDGESEESLKNSKIYVQYSAFNDKLEELAAVNKALQSTQTGTLEANNLLDKRDLILNDIAAYTDITVDEKDNGSVNVYVGNTALVKGSKVVGSLDVQTAKSYCEQNGLVYPDDWIVKDDDGNPVLDSNGNTIQREAAVISISGDVNVSDANSIFTGGALGGLIHSADNDADSINAGKVQSSLNTLSQAIADVFNALNTQVGTDGNNAAYCINPNDTSKLTATTSTNYLFINSSVEPTVDADGNLVYSTDGINASNIALNPNLYTDDGIWSIACAFFSDGSNFDENAVGNAQNVANMLGTRNEKIDSLNGMSIEDYYTSMLGKIAAGGSSTQSLYDTQSDLVDSISNQISSATSVDLNEELVDLVKYQTAYAAAAQVFNTVNSCLDTLMSLGG
jgi:flagellar hook-associated protein 1 FlgK